MTNCTQCNKELVTGKGVMFDDAIFSKGECLECHEKNFKFDNIPVSEMFGANLLAK